MHVYFMLRKARGRGGEEIPPHTDYQITAGCSVYFHGLLMTPVTDLAYVDIHP